MFKQRPGTAGIAAELYNTKLISLLYFRAVHNHSIIDFQLASNVDQIGAFDDICFRGLVAGDGKPIMIFIKAKHIENKKQIFKIDLYPYFCSYLKIREHFDPNSKDFFFKGKFDETESFFVLYTTARDGFNNDESKAGSGICSILNDLIETGGTAKQLNKQEKHVKYLCEVAMKEDMTFLAKRIAQFINEDSDVDMLLTNEIVLRYHVILARQVFDVSEIQPDGHRIASFRHDFFDTYEKYLTIFKDSLFKEILKKRKIRSTDIKSLLFEFLTKPTDILLLSKLIETIITYNNGFLEINKKYTDYFGPELKHVHVSQQAVDKAIDIAARDILLSPKFNLRVPSAFGNKDLTIRGSKEKQEKRINYITTTIINLLDKCKSSKIVTIDNFLGVGFLQLNGGIAGAIGNIFVHDDNTKLMKVTDNCNQLGPLAESLYTKLNSKINNIHEYKFHFKTNNIPKISMDCSTYEENLARDFLNRLLLYSKQADNHRVEHILKTEIDLYHQNYFQAEAIFLKFHDQILKWFMEPDEKQYLTRKFYLFQKSVKASFQNPLMSSLNIMYLTKMKDYNYTFTEDAVSFLKSYHLYQSSIIITEFSELTVLKVLQLFKYSNYVVLDFEHIDHLPINVCDVLCTELLNTGENIVLILVYDKTNSRQNLKMISQAVRSKTTNIVVVTNQTSFEITHEYFPKVHKVIQDKKLSLIDLSEQSQMTLLENATVMFPGVEIKLDLLLRDWAKTGSRFPCVTAPRARQQSDDKDANTSQGRKVSATAAAADDEIERQLSTQRTKNLWLAYFKRLSFSRLQDLN